MLTFDDVPGGSIQGTYGDLPGPGAGSDYLGFQFNETLDWFDVESSDSDSGAHSGDFAVLNNSYDAGVGVVTEASGEDFTFTGLWAKKWGAGPESGGEPSVFGTLEGWKDGEQVWSLDAALNGSYAYFGGNELAIDELRIVMDNNFLMDDLELNGSIAPSAVPVPAALPLLGGGLLALGAVARRRRA